MTILLEDRPMEGPGQRLEKGTELEKKNWIHQTFPFYGLNLILNHYLDLECWIIPADDRNNWVGIRQYRRQTWPLEYDHQYGKREERLQFNETQLNEALKEKRTLFATRRGLSDLFVPILKKGKVIGFLEFGDFLKTLPTKEGLRKEWKGLTGFEASESNIDFLRYVRVVLETPVLEGAAYQAIRQILETYAKVLAGEEDPEKAYQLARKLQTEVIAPNYPHLLWMEKVAQNSWVYPPKSWLNPLYKGWEKDELRSGRIPTTILAMGIEYERSGTPGELDRIFQNYHFQRELFQFSKGLPHTKAYPLGDYGMAFFTSPDPSQNAVQAKLEILDRIDQITQFAEKKLKVKLLVGASRFPRPGGDLSGVLREAVTALSFSNNLRRSVLFYEDIRSNPSVPEPENYYDWSKQLIEACLLSSIAEVESARKQYTEKVLAHSVGLPGTVRIHFFYTFGRIMDETKKRLPIEGANLAFIYKTFERRLQEAENIAGLIAVFYDSLEGVLRLKAKPRGASQAIRLEAVKSYIDGNFAQDLKLEQVARENGFSLTVFSRGFKKVVGMSFPAYLRKLRLEQAQKLLVTTQLPIAQISAECGFNNLQYFFDLFHRSTGCTPQKFRDPGK